MITVTDTSNKISISLLYQVGSVCHLVQSENPGSHACSIDSLRTSVLLGLLNQIMEVSSRFVTSEVI